MSSPFRPTFGFPEPAELLSLPQETPHRGWLQNEVGAGWFLNRYLYLFGPGLDRLHDCLDTWSFTVPPRPPGRTILGYNAHGCIVVLEDPASLEIRILNPFLGRYWGDESCNLRSLFDQWMPKKRVPEFFDLQMYEEFTIVNERSLRPQHILAQKELLILGGDWALENFAEEDIVEFYRRAAPVYRLALQK